MKYNLSGSLTSPAGAIREGVLDDHSFMLRKIVGNSCDIPRRDCSLRVAFDGITHRGVTELLIEPEISTVESAIKNSTDDVLREEERNWLDYFLFNRIESSGSEPSLCPRLSDSATVRSMTVLDDTDSIVLPGG